MNEVAVKAYMREVYDEHVAPLTGEGNATLLAEDAAQVLDLYGPAPEYDIPDVVFEWAHEVEWEKEE